ncbi:MAG: type II secretion system F family protein [Candidatus Paceibacterota bacterium]
MLFKYTTIDNEGNERQGSIEAVSEEVAINALQRRGLTISDIQKGNSGSIFQRRITWLERVSNKEVVILSQQISTLFSAQVSALKIFKLLGSEMENPKLRDALENITTEIQGGSTLADAMKKQPDIFSGFYVNMVRAGEESGKLEETFQSLSEYLERMYELSSKAKNALIYPAFVIFTFISVMVLMLTLVIPKISTILTESGQEIPIYTKVVIGISSFLVNYGVFLLVLLVVGGFFLYRFAKTDEGKHVLSRIKLATPFFGGLYQKLYLSRLADNMHTMLGSGIPMVRAVEVTSDVVDNVIYEDILNEVAEKIKGGTAVSEALGSHEEIPSIMIQMMKVGEESGELKSILKTLSDFYQREVNNAVDTMVDLIEPAMIVLLGVGVAILLAAVLMPIYNITGTI